MRLCTSARPLLIQGSDILIQALIHPELPLIYIPVGPIGLQDAAFPGKQLSKVFCYPLFLYAQTCQNHISQGFRLIVLQLNNRMLKHIRNDLAPDPAVSDSSSYGYSSRIRLSTFRVLMQSLREKATPSITARTKLP